MKKEKNIQKKYTTKKTINLKSQFFRLSIMVLIVAQTLSASSQIKFPNTIKTGNNAPIGKQYVYKLTLYKIGNSSYPGVKTKLKLMQNAAILNGDAMLYPQLKSDFGMLAKVCPIFLFGYKNASFNADCTTPERASLEFTNETVIGSKISMNIPADQLNIDTKLTLGIYGAEIMLPNGIIKKLKKANVKTFRLLDMDFPARNFLKYEINIDGALVTLEYIVERAISN